MRLLTCLFFAVAFTTSIANARALSPLEQSSLKVTIAQFIDDMQQGNMKGVTDIIPSRLIDNISQEAEVTPSELRKIIADQMNEIMADVTVEAVEIDISELDVTDAINTDGTDAVYALVPYSYSMTIRGQPVSPTSALIALQENGKWSLIRIDPLEMALLIELYPFLKDIDF